MRRRDFFAVAGSGLFVFFSADLDAFQERGRFPGRQAGPTDFNAYLHIGADGRVTCFVGKIEMGQGNMTALAQLLAEELDVLYDSVDMVMGDTDRCPYDMGTFGSMSVRMVGPVLRAAGAEARAVLIQMAAEQFHAPPERLQAKAGVITDPLAPDKRVTYAQLVQGKRIERRIENVPLKPAAAFTIIGTSPQRKDALEKVTGKAKYAGDFSLPGMLHARVLRPPAYGATLTNVDTSAAEKVPGARVVREGDLIAALHERPDLADQALGLIKAQFDRPHDRPQRQEHLRPPAQDRAGAPGRWPRRQHCGRREARRRHRRRDLSQQLRGARAHGDSHRRRQHRERQSHRVGQHAGALLGEAAGGAGSRLPAGKRPYHHSLRGRRIWREESEHRRPSKPRAWRRPPANRSKWSGTAPMSSFSIPSGRPPW